MHNAHTEFLTNTSFFIRNFGHKREKCLKLHYPPKVSFDRLNFLKLKNRFRKLWFFLQSPRSNFNFECVRSLGSYIKLIVVEIVLFWHTLVVISQSLRWWEVQNPVQNLACSWQ